MTIIKFLSKLSLFCVFFLTVFLFGQKIDVKVNGVVLGNIDPNSINLTSTDNILLILSTENKTISDLDFNLFLNGKEITYEKLSDKTAHIQLGKLAVGNYIFKAVYKDTEDGKVTVYRFNIHEKKKTISPPIIKKNEVTESSNQIMTPAVIILFMVCLIQLIIIVLLYRGKGKIKDESVDEIEEFNKQVLELKSAFESCKNNTKRLNDKNKKLVEEINSLEKNINELEEINIVLVEQKEKLQTKKTQLEELQKQKDDLFAMAVHDIKNPASVIQSLIQLMESYDLTATEQSEIMQTLVESTQNIIKLSKEMSEVILRQKDSDLLDKENASIKEVIDSVVTMNIAYAKKKNIKLLNHSSDSIPKIKFDPLKIKEVVDNLVNNAIKYGPEKTVVEVKAYFSETKITVEVSDTGSGLSEHDLKIMFSKGMTLSTKPTGGEHSSGLGLWLSKKIIDEHGGKIWAKSKLGVGTKFYFELPIE